MGRAPFDGPGGRSCPTRCRDTIAACPRPSARSCWPPARSPAPRRASRASPSSAGCSASRSRCAVRTSPGSSTAPSRERGRDLAAAPIRRGPRELRARRARVSRRSRRLTACRYRREGPARRQRLPDRRPAPRPAPIARRSARKGGSHACDPSSIPVRDRPRSTVRAGPGSRRAGQRPRRRQGGQRLQEAQPRLRHRRRRAHHRPQPRQPMGPGLRAGDARVGVRQRHRRLDAVLRRRAQAASR